MKKPDRNVKRFFSTAAAPVVLAVFALLAAALFTPGVTGTLEAAAGSLKVLYPNGGEKVAVGSRVVIKWRSDGLAGDGKIVLILYKKGIKHSVIVKQTPNSGKYSWNVPRSLPAGADYRIRIRSLKDLSVNDFSNRNFSIKK